MRRPTEVSGNCSITRPPASADSANIEPLYATRSGGRCPTRCVTVGPPAATITPACQPKSRIAATAKTKPSVTPPASTPSTGTGKRSARTMQRKRPASARTSRLECGWRPYETQAARAATAPAAQTGATTARTLDGTGAVLLTARGRCRMSTDSPSPPHPRVDRRSLPGSPTEVARREVEAQRCGGGDDADDECHEPRVPLQHVIPPVALGRQTGTILRARRHARNHPKRGTCGTRHKSLERGSYCRPASASGRRAHANSRAYQPSRRATATPYSEEWMNQPL